MSPVRNFESYSVGLNPFGNNHTLFRISNGVNPNNNLTTDEHREIKPQINTRLSHDLNKLIIFSSLISWQSVKSCGSIFSFPVEFLTG